jgi:hypothetical protein
MTCPAKMPVIEEVELYTFCTMFPQTIGRTPDILETFEKCSILFKFKEDEDFNHRNTLSISRIKI